MVRSSVPTLRNPPQPLRNKARRALWKRPLAGWPPEVLARPAHHSDVIRAEAHLGQSLVTEVIPLVTV